MISVSMLSLSSMSACHWIVLEAPPSDLSPLGLYRSYVVFDRFHVGVVAAVGPKADSKSGRGIGRGCWLLIVGCRQSFCIEYGG